jgi:hypothetical protein
MAASMFLNICLFCNEPPGRCHCGQPEPCQNCGMLGCVCSPSLCCGLPWAPMDWQFAPHCSYCGEIVTRNADGVVYRVEISGQPKITEERAPVRDR